MTRAIIIFRAHIYISKQMWRSLEHKTSLIGIVMPDPQRDRKLCESSAIHHASINNMLVSAAKIITNKPASPAQITTFVHRVLRSQKNTLAGGCDNIMQIHPYNAEYFCINHGDKRFSFNLKSILMSYKCLSHFISIPMLWVYGHYIF